MPEMNEQFHLIFHIVQSAGDFIHDCGYGKIAVPPLVMRKAIQPIDRVRDKEGRLVPLNPEEALAIRKLREKVIEMIVEDVSKHLMAFMETHDTIHGERQKNGG